MVGSHQLAKEYAMQGHTVFHISAPITPLHKFGDKYKSRLKLNQLGVYLYSDGLMNWIPQSLVPWQIAKWIIGTKNLFVSTIKGLSKALDDMGMMEPDIVFIDEPRMCGMELLLKAKKIIYRPTDIYFEMKQDAKIVSAEKRILKTASGVAATSTSVLAHILSLNSKVRGKVFENGFSLPIAEEKKPMPGKYLRGIYYGAFDERFDIALCQKMALHNPTVIFDVYSPDISDLSTTGSQNLCLLPGVKYKDLPQLLEKYDFGFLPFSNHPSNEGRSPMKLYEMYASGLPVVSVRTKELNHRELPFVKFLDSSENISELLASISPMVFDLEFRRSFLNNKTWSSISRQLLNFSLSTTQSS